MPHLSWISGTSLAESTCQEKPSPTLVAQDTAGCPRPGQEERKAPMDHRIKPFLAGSLAAVIALGAGTFTLAQGGSHLDAQKIAAASGTQATTKDGVVRIEWPRKDVPVQVDGMPLKPFAGLGSWAAFTAAPHGAV